MKQFLILTTTEAHFQELVDDKLKNGYKVIAGSMFVKSLPWDISIPEGEMLNDVDHVLTLAITGKHDFLIYAKDVNVFLGEVNSKLPQGVYTMVVGSLSVHLVKDDGFDEKAKRAYTTYYSCGLYKE
jgi:hypothetical protein